MEHTKSTRLLIMVFAPLVVLNIPALSASRIVPDRALVIGGVVRGGRDTFPRDLVQYRLVLGKWRTPTSGERLAEDADVVWEEIRSTGEGRFRHPALRGGYALVIVRIQEAQVYLLEATGHSVVYVNGQPRTGDPYGLGYVRLPVALHAGDNELLFACGRGEFTVRLDPLPAPVMLNVGDSTLPDLVRGSSVQPLAAVPIVNGTAEVIRGAVITARSSGHVVHSRVPDIPPLSVRKVPFRLPPASNNAPNEMTVRLSVTCRVSGKTRDVDSQDIKVRVRNASETRKVTFVSEIDGSVQYYAVVPPRVPAKPRPSETGAWPWLPVVGTYPTNLEAGAVGAVQLYGYWRLREDLRKTAPPRPGLVLTLHGAGVEAIGQAASYAPKRDLWIVAPTNRRPFGFDWEEWGRMDALEVLARARQDLRTDPARTYLTGHSMGGHGAWHLSVTFPELFAAVGPSAGWISFRSYAGGIAYDQASAVEGILRRASSPSDTLSLATNLEPLGVYILHGDKDDNVPVTEARTMAARLEGFHRNFVLFEQPGAGHWWGAPSDPGTGCVDWPAMFDLFHRSQISPTDETRHVTFSTMNPGVSASMRWLSILQQQRSLEPSSATIRCDPVGRRFVGSTSNVATLLLDTSSMDPGGSISLELDGWKSEIPLPEGSSTICLRKTTDGWRVAPPPSRTEKGPGRAGPFKEAFSHRFVLVYATGGSEDENAWSFAKARFDAETFWYRGNGAPDVVADSEFDPKRYANRSIILYGNADTNKAWTALLGACPVRLGRNSLKIGTSNLEGDALACLFCYPRADSPTAMVAVVGGTGLAGMRLTDRAPYFVSGTAFPDLLVWTPETLRSGVAGARAAGFFGNDWSVEQGEFAVTP